MSRITHKRGATFSYLGTALMYVDGVRVADLTGWTGSAVVRTKEGNRVVETLTFTWIDITQSRFLIESVNDTSAWPADEAVCDVLLTSQLGKRVPSKTFTIEMERKVS